MARGGNYYRNYRRRYYRPRGSREKLVDAFLSLGLFVKLIPDLVILSQGEY